MSAVGRYRYVVLVVLGVLSMLSQAQDAAIPNAPQLGVLLAPRHVKAGRVYVQGQIRLRVRIVSPHPFDKLSLNMPSIDGVRAVTLVKPRTSEVYVYGQTGYAYETWLALFPQRSGELHIPAISVSGAVAAGPGDLRSFHERWPGTTLTVRPIDPRLESNWWLVADQVTIEESWSPQPKDFRVEDTVQRHVTLTVHGATPEHLPDLEQGRNAGYAVVGMRSDSRTKLSRDGVVTRLRQTWDITVQSKDVFYISPIQLDYWDPATDAPATASLAAKRVEPLARDVEAVRQGLVDAAIAAQRSRHYAALAVLGVPVLLSLGLLAVSAWYALPTRADRRLRRACRPDTPMQACLAAVNAWADRRFGYRGGDVVNRLQGTLGARPTTGLVDLQSAIYSDACAADAAMPTSRSPQSPPRLASALTWAARMNRVRDLWRGIGHGLARTLIG